MLGFLFIPKTDEPAIGLICKLQDGRVGRVDEVKEFGKERYCNLSLFYQGKEEMVSIDITELTVVDPKYVTDDVYQGDTIVVYDKLEETLEYLVLELLPVDTKNLEEGLKDDIEIILKQDGSILKSEFGKRWYKEIKCGICHESIQLGQSVERNKGMEIVHIACNIGNLGVLN